MNCLKVLELFLHKNYKAQASVLTCEKLKCASFSPDTWETELDVPLNIQQSKDAT